MTAVGFVLFVVIGLIFYVWSRADPIGFRLAGGIGMLVLSLLLLLGIALMLAGAGLWLWETMP